MSTHQFLVHQTDLAQTRWRTSTDTALAAGQVRVGVERIALTANNITYAAFGHAMHYWDFFPAGEPGWGIVPTWGFGRVLQSLHPGFAVGERLYGYFPMANQVLLQPQAPTERGFRDGAPHRGALHPLYNHYLRCAADPLHQPDTADLEALCRPLFMTAWLIDDFLADNAWFGAAEGGATVQLLLSSASSKTALATAQALARRPGVEVVGLTSERNAAYCRSLGCYHRVLVYEALEQVAADAPCIYIDFAGNATLRRRIHERFSRLAYSCAVGGTHVADLGGGKGLPGPAPTLFFAPAQADKRRAQWGGEGFGERLLQAWRAFMVQVASPTPPWLQVREARGQQAVAAAYAEVLGGTTDPRTGWILVLD